VLTASRNYSHLLRVKISSVLNFTVFKTQEQQSDQNLLCTELHYSGVLGTLQIEIVNDNCKVLSVHL